MTFGEAEKKFIEDLVRVYDQDESKALAGLTLSHISRLSRGQLLMKRNEQLEPGAEASVLMILDELKSGKPLQYILGETEFLGLRFLVNPSVLIPRPETEELVDWIIQEAEKNQHYISILDIGTGSGCIPVALKKKLPAMKVSAIDISFEALETAMRNAVLNGTEVTFKRVDILNPEPAFPDHKYSIIVSNPPYITETEKEQMHQNVLDFEPHTALFVKDTDPLLFY
ncbi:MAG TPA: peptide chain release factor N(5)-glutamine methyltransferase, partial [Sphingobacteriaceae bacterium]